ncbi:helix-turn-helix transcriptional regulator [Phycicoccus flavus]|uniref:helix-turn-helix transcriptional regulator n=1 Tax=Phycicoccus flavus TaxID=2502783 RepID=UPI000FEB7E5D|nr:WYL domain-containing protein [Phycicoccus flavus]NHA66719.1 WYL domain-containing protein [Phycicoccus flavus]
MNRAERLHALTESLRRAGPGGRTAERLAEDFGVSVRTVKRDLAALAAAGLPVWGRTGPGGGYGLAERASLPPVTLTPGQAVALAAAVAATPHAPYADAGRAAVRKVLDVLDPGTRHRARRLADRVWVDVPDGPPRRVMSPLEAAMLDQLVVRIDYADRAGTRTRREVEPMIFAWAHGRWYLVAWCRLRRAVRWFDLRRVERAVATRTPCTGHDVGEIGRPPETAGPVADL